MTNRPQNTAATPSANIAGERAQPLSAEAVRELTSDRRYSRAGLALIALTFGVFGTWAALAPLDSAALAPGVLVVETRHKSIQHLEGGIVERIHVREGQPVKKGSLLLELDETQAQAQLGIVRGRFIALLAHRDRLMAERDNLELTFSEASGDIEADARLRDAREGQRRVFTARRKAQQGETEILEQQVEQLQANINGLQRMAGSHRQRIASYREEVGDHNRLLEKGYVNKLRVNELEREQAELEGELAQSLSGIAASELRVAETRMEILQQRKLFTAEVVGELRQVQNEIFDLEERLRALQDTLERTRIYAPENGIIMDLSVASSGAVIAPGEQIMSIVPQADALIVEARVSASDIDRVSIGQSADLRFSAFRTAVVPVAKGQLIGLSADRYVNEATGAPYYLARIQIGEEALANLGQLSLLPGMPAEVFINTGERTFLQYLTRPASDMVARSMLED